MSNAIVRPAPPTMSPLTANSFERPLEMTMPFPRVAVKYLPSLETVAGYETPSLTTTMFARSDAEAEPDWFHRIELTVMSSCEPAVRRTVEKVYPDVPTGLEASAPGIETYVAVTSESASVSFIVCVAPTIGREPLTVAVVLTPTTANEASSPPLTFAAEDMLPATVYVIDAPRRRGEGSPIVALWFL